MAGETGAERGALASVRARLAWIDRRLLSLIAGSLVLVALGGLIQVSFGAYAMSIDQVWRTVLDPDLVLDPQLWTAFLLGGELPEMGKESLIVWNIRMPRVVVGVFVGMNLAVSGAIFQAITRNELASPYILGVSSGAGLAVLLVLVVFSGLAVYLPLFATVGGMAAFLLVYAIAWKGGTNPVRLVLAGIIVSTVFSSLQTGLYFFAGDIGAVKAAIAWTTGSLTGVDWEQVRLVLPWSVIALGAALAGSRQLNVLLLGEGTARSLGMSVERMRFGLAGIGVLCAAAAVAVAGLVGFVGLIVPHVVRTIVGSDYKRLLVGCVFAGPALMIVADVGARLALNPVQLPVGIVTGVIGGPYFLYLMRKQDSLGEL